MESVWVSNNGWMNKENVVYMEFYSTIKKNEIMSFVGKWVELDITMFSEISQPHKQKCHMLSFIY
jgi:hypothetical protein